MRKSVYAIFVLWLIPIAIPLYPNTPKLSLHYTVDITKFDDDSFFVKLDVENFDMDTAVFQFAVTAPGTYSILDAGRFVGSFKALDTSGNPLMIVRTGVNQFLIYPARQLSRVTYRVDDTFDSPLPDNPVAPMSGTNIERTNAVVNGQMVFGFFHGRQSYPISVKFVYPEIWRAGTSLQLTNGEYTASSFDELADSPFLFGDISRSTISMGRTNIDIYAFSENRKFNAEFVAARLHDVLGAADQFLGGLPVERYVFLFHFREYTGPVYGAWEHNYSSFYVIPEWSESYISQTITSMSAHEFFHVVIPLNIHSELIVPFNFEKTVPSQHLWFYEGVTEWASDLMQVRYGTMSDTELMNQITEKMRRADYYDNSVSLVDMSLGSYDRYEKLYGNIYERGALTALLLDMRLLELSEGKTGLREVISKLSQQFGPARPFPENGFFDLLVQLTYPEIEDFIHRYIKGTETLPIKEYLLKAGYDYETEARTGLYESSLGKFSFNLKNGTILVEQVDPKDSVNQRLGIQQGDIIQKLNYAGVDLRMRDTAMIRAMNFALIGEPFEWVVMRGDSKLRLKAFVGQRDILEYHVIKSRLSFTAEQKRFRAWWLGRP
ncbi:peptidase [bacterium]|nr:peptidase [bacterium]